MTAFMNLRTSPSPISLACVVALSLLAPPVAARGPATPVLANMSFAPAPASAPASAAAEPAKAVAPCPAAQEAIAGTSPDKYGEAARHYEQCARASGDAGLWKKAGMARYSARQYAHAIQALDMYMRSGTADPQGEVMLADARKNAATVRFSVVMAPGAPTPERLRIAPRDGKAGDEIDLPWSRAAVSFDVLLDAGQWTAELTMPGGGRVGPQDIQATKDTGTPQVVLFRVEAPVEVVPPVPTMAPVEVELSLGPAAALRQGVKLEWRGPTPGEPRPVRTATTRWPLAPGAWQLHLEAPRFEAQTRDVQVRAGEPHSLSLTLVRTREERLRIGLAAGLGGAAIGLFAGGLVGVIGGRRDYREAVARLDGTPNAANRQATSDALVSIRHSSNGVMVATAAAGTGLAAITVGAGGSDQLLGAEIGVGGAVLVAGIAWLVPAKRQYAADVPTDGQPWAPDRVYLDEHRRPELVAAGLIGLGAGLAAGATVALVARKIVGRSSGRRASLSPITAPRAVGLAIHGTF